MYLKSTKYGFDIFCTVYKFRNDCITKYYYNSIENIIEVAKCVDPTSGEKTSNNFLIYQSEQ